MGRIFGLLVIVCAIWVGMEVYNYGVSGAFGGALAGLHGESRAPQEATRRSVPQRAGAAVEDAYGAAEERRNRLLGE